MTDAPERGFGVVVPARYASTRLPGKPLLDLGGKPMVVRVMENAIGAGATFTVCATDDERIAAAVRAAGYEALLTSPEHATGTDRLAEVARRKQLPPELVVVNLQGDEPGVPAALVKQVAQALLDNPSASLATLATPLTRAEELFDENVVKVVTDRQRRALYFSRAPIPWHRGQFKLGASQAPLQPGAFLRHVGLYAYKVSTLHELSRTAPAPIELVESLEQLRALWLGLAIQVELVDELPAGGVDTPADAERMRLVYAS